MAYRQGLTLIAMRGAASEVRSILADEAVNRLSKDSDNFWVLAAAMSRYVDNEGNGQLPIEVRQQPTLTCHLHACGQGA